MSCPTMRQLPQAQPAVRVQEGKGKVHYIESITTGVLNDRKLRRMDGARLYAALHKRSELLEKAKELGIESVKETPSVTLTYYQIEKVTSPLCSTKRLIATTAASVAAAVLVVQLSVSQRACLTVRLSCSQGCSMQITEPSPTMIFSSILAKNSTGSPSRNNAVVDKVEDSQSNATENSDGHVEHKELNSQVVSNKEYKSAHVTAFNTCTALWRQLPSPECELLVSGSSPEFKNNNIPAEGMSQSADSSSCSSSSTSDASLGEVILDDCLSTKSLIQRSRKRSHKRTPTILHQPGKFNILVKVAGFEQKRIKESLVTNSTTEKPTATTQKLKSETANNYNSRCDLFEDISKDPISPGAGFDILIKTAIITGRTSPMLGLLTLLQDVTGIQNPTYPLFRDAARSIDRPHPGCYIRGLTSTASSGIATFSATATSDISISPIRNYNSPIINTVGFAFPWACVHEGKKQKKKSNNFERGYVHFV